MVTVGSPDYLESLGNPGPDSPLEKAVIQSYASSKGIVCRVEDRLATLVITPAAMV